MFSCTFAIQEWSKMGDRFRNRRCFVLKTAPEAPKTSPRGPKTAQKAPKMLPRCLQEGPKDPQEDQKTAQETPKTLPRGPQRLPILPMRSHDGSRSFEEAPGMTPRPARDDISAHRWPPSVYAYVQTNGSAKGGGGLVGTREALRIITGPIIIVVGGLFNEEGSSLNCEYCDYLLLIQSSVANCVCCY